MNLFHRFPTHSRGREPVLQSQSLFSTLQGIRELALLTEDQVNILQDGYLFLRRVENLLQCIDDQQTQTLPERLLNQARLAWGMGFADWPAFYQVLSQKWFAVHQIFTEQIGQEDDSENIDVFDEIYITLWQSELSKKN